MKEKNLSPFTDNLTAIEVKKKKKRTFSDISFIFPHTDLCT